MVHPQSGFPLDVGWPIWGAGLRIVYSHDGPFGIYGSRSFVAFPADSNENRPIVVQNFDSPEQSSYVPSARCWTVDKYFAEKIKVRAWKLVVVAHVWSLLRPCWIWIRSKTEFGQ